MRKVFRTMIALMLAFCLLGSAAGCSGGSDTDEGYWIITAYREEGETYKGDELPKIGTDGYLVLESGGTGYFTVGNRSYEIAWGAGKIECARFGLDFVRSGSVLTANGRRADDMEGIVYTFEKSKDAAPARPAGIISVDDSSRPDAAESSAAESSQESREESLAEESSTEESSEEESSQAESSKEETSKEESSKAESSKEDSSKEESSKAESSKPEDVTANVAQGYYETVKVVRNGETFEGEVLAEAQYDYMLALEDGGMGYFAYLPENSALELVWDKTTIDMGILFMEYTLDGITIQAHMTSGEADIGEFTFRKISDECPARPMNVENYLINGEVPEALKDLPEFLQITDPSLTAPAGGYVVTTYIIDGEEYAPDGNGIVFYENGTAELNFTGMVETTDWTYTDGVLAIEASDGTYYGTLSVSDGVLRLADSYYDDYYYTMEPGTPIFIQDDHELSAEELIKAVEPFIGEYQGFLHVYNTKGFGGYMEDGLEMVSQFFARIGVNSDGTPFVGFQTFYDAVHAFGPLQAEYIPEDEAISVTGQFLGIPFGADFTKPQDDGSLRIVGAAADGGVSYDYEIYIKPLDADWTVGEVPVYTDGDVPAHAQNYVEELDMFKGDDLQTRLKEYAAVLDPEDEVDLSVFEFDKPVYNVVINGAGPDTLTVQYLDDNKTVGWMYDTAVFQENVDDESGLKLTADNDNIYIYTEFSTGETAFADYIELVKSEEKNGSIDHLVIEDLTLGPYTVKKLYYRLVSSDIYGADYLVMLDKASSAGYYGVDVIVFDDLQRAEGIDNADIRNLISSLQFD